jgi:hypothetical protein
LETLSLVVSVVVVAVHLVFVVAALEGVSMVLFVVPMVVVGVFVFVDILCWVFVLVACVVEWVHFVTAL